MPNFEDGSYSSTAGRALIAKVLAGRCQMHYTRAAVGKGSIPEGMTPKNMTEPAGYVMDAKISAVGNPVDGECQVSVQINSSDVTEGFYATGILLYAADPDEGEVPYTYLVLEEEPERIRPASAAVGKLATFDLIAAVDEIDRVTATIDPEAVMTYKAVEQLIAAAIVTKEITIPATGWTSNQEPLEPGGGEDAEESDTVESVEEPDGDGTTTNEEPPGLHIDITVLEATEETVPQLAILPIYADTARSCGLYTTCKSTEGAIRLYAKKAPSSEIKASLTLFNVQPSAENGVSVLITQNGTEEE